MNQSVWRFLLILPAALYAGAIPLVANLQVDRSFRLLLYQNRPYVVLAGLVAALAGLVVFAPRKTSRFLSTSWQRRLLLLGLSFPIYYALVAVVKGRVVLPVIGLYFSWAVAVFFAVPALFGARRRVRGLVIGLFVANSLAWLLGYYLFQSPGAITTFETRESFGYSNPNTYAQILQVIACAAAFLLVIPNGRRLRSRGARLMLIGVIAACGYFVYAASSRNVMAFAVSAAATYFLLGGKKGRPLITSLAIAAAAVGAVIVLSTSDFQEIDRFSSSRLTVWNRTVDVAFTRGDDARAFLIGTDRDITPEISGGGYSDIRSSAKFEKFHVDNFYLELLVEGGLIGLLLFLWPYIFLIRLLWRLRRDPSKRNEVNLGLAFVAGLAIQGLFISTIPSFNNPIGFAFAVTMTALVASAMNDTRG